MEAQAHLGSVVFPLYPSVHHTGNSRLLLFSDGRGAAWARRGLGIFGDVTVREAHFPTIGRETRPRSVSQRFGTKRNPGGGTGVSLERGFMNEGVKQRQRVAIRAHARP